MMDYYDDITDFIGESIDDRTTEYTCSMCGELICTLLVDDDNELLCLGCQYELDIIQQCKEFMLIFLDFLLCGGKLPMRFVIILYNGFDLLTLM